MKREDIEKRMIDLERSIAQTNANLNVLLGQREECQHFLKCLDEEKRQIDENVIDINTAS